MFMLSTWPRTTIDVPRGKVFLASATRFSTPEETDPRSASLYVGLDVEARERVVVRHVHRRHVALQTGEVTEHGGHVGYGAGG